MVEIYKGQKIHIDIQRRFIALSSPFDLPVYETSHEIYINNRKISKRIKELTEAMPKDEHTDIAHVYLGIAKQLIDKKIYAGLDE